MTTKTIMLLPMFAIIASLAMMPSVFAENENVKPANYQQQLGLLDNLINNLTNANTGLGSLIDNRMTNNVEAFSAIAVYENQINIAQLDSNSTQDYIDVLGELLFDFIQKVHVNNSVILDAETEIEVNLDMIDVYQSKIAAINAMIDN